MRDTCVRVGYGRAKQDDTPHAHTYNARGYELPFVRTLSAQFSPNADNVTRDETGTCTELLSVCVASWSRAVEMLRVFVVVAMVVVIVGGVEQCSAERWLERMTRKEPPNQRHESPLVVVDPAITTRCHASILFT